MFFRGKGKLRLLLKTAASLLRIGLCALLGWSCIADNPARKMRVQLAAMPDLDYVAEVRSCREHRRFGEGALVVEAGRKQLSGEKLRALEEEAAKLAAERDSIVRRVREFGIGAVVGEGESLEALVGAVTADFFVVGDVRDLIVQGTKYSLDGDADKLIIALSAVGVMTTAVPTLDPAVALFKVAKKSGHLTTGFSKRLLEMAQSARATKSAGNLAEVSADAVKLAEKASPGGAIRLLRHVDDPADLKRMGYFVERNGDGAFALLKTGDEGARLVKTGAAGVDDLVLAAAKKGEKGRGWLRMAGPRALHPHPAIGLLKAWRAKRLEQLAERFIAEVLDPYYNAVLAALAGWMLFELALLYFRLRQLFRPAPAVAT